ncbi:hypothetical protein FACS1894133_5950 [Clostridia bacterium]|nr:hypothetical protein FACS1894133_5950 [Clostridia bacterium]
MQTTNATNFRKDCFNFFEQTVKWGENVTVTTKDGNAVIMSEDEYNGLMETLYLCSVPNMREKLIAGMNTPIDECVSEDEVTW